MQTYLSTSLPFPPARPIEIKTPTPVNFLILRSTITQVVNKYIYIYMIPPLGGGGVGGLLFLCGDWIYKQASHLYPWQGWRRESWKHITYSFSYI